MPRSSRRRTVKDIKDSAKEKPIKVSEPKELNIGLKDLVSAGSAVLNCSMSDNPHGAFKLGTIANFIGDSGDGKTFTCLTTLAECANSRRFNKYTLINDDAEHRNDFDIAYLYGDKTAGRIKAPKYDEETGEPIYSETIEDFELHVHKLLDSKQPFIYILDSMDALDSKAEEKKVQENLKKREKGEKEDGDYQMAKPKKMSQILRQIKAKLKKTKSLIIIVSQTRDNIGIGFAEKKRSGGRALKFYCGHESWIAKVKELKKTVNKRERAIGILSRVKTKKNSITGKKREADIHIYYDYGIDDVGGNIAYLISEEFWEKKKNTLIISEFDFEGTKESLIALVEEKELEMKLRDMVGQCWNDIEESFRFNDRKRRFQ